NYGGSGNFELFTSGVPFSGSTTITFRFRPTTLGPKSLTIVVTIIHHLPNGTVNNVSNVPPLTVTGVGIPADDPFSGEATLSATSHDFGSVDLGNTVYFVFELVHGGPSNDTLTITGITFQQGLDQSFSYNATVGVPFGIPFPVSTVIVVHFRPTTL